MNSNMFHNLANIATVLLAMITAGLMASGCVQTVTGGFDCHASWLNPGWVLAIIGVVQALKIGVNLVRDGLGGMFKPQPPVNP